MKKCFVYHVISNFVTVFNQSYNCQTSHYLGRNRLPRPCLMLPSLGWTNVNIVSACYLKSEKRSWKDIWKVLERSQKGPRKIYRKGRWNVSERYWRGPRNYVLREFLGSSQRVVREFPGSQEDPSSWYAWKNDYESHSLVLVAERLQKGCRKVAEGLQNGCRKVAERLRKGYRKVPGRL